MKLYHGTDAFFEHPDLSMCRPFKDFGRGFYLTPDLAVAKRMAERCVERSDWQGAPKYVYVYDFDESDLSALQVKNFAPAVDEAFARFVMANRQARSKAANHNRDNRYDIVVGPIADDKMGVLFRRFEDGEITIDYLINELKFRKLSMQYSFHTGKALQKLNLKEVRRV
jgi:hypothetical protein